MLKDEPAISGGMWQDSFMKNVSLLFLATLVSCGLGGSKTPLEFSVKVDEAVRAEEVNFEVLQKKVLPKCIGCHKDWTSEEVVNRFTRKNLPDESRLFTTIKNASMPKNSPPLSGELLEITRNYIQNIVYKAPEERPLPDGPVTFDVLNEQVFKVSCLPCHATRALKDEVSLGKWIDKANPEQSKLLTSVVSGKMPKERNFLTPNQIELIRRYIQRFQQP